MPENVFYPSTFVYSRFPPKVQSWTELWNSIFSCTFFLFMFFETLLKDFLFYSPISLTLWFRYLQRCIKEIWIKQTVKKLNIWGKTAVNKSTWIKAWSCLQDILVHGIHIHSHLSSVFFKGMHASKQAAPDLYCIPFCCKFYGILYKIIWKSPLSTCFTDPIVGGPFFNIDVTVKKDISNNLPFFFNQKIGLVDMIF